MNRAEDIVARYGAGGVKEGTPFFLYVAFAHTHTPMGYTAAWAGTSARPKPPARSSSVYGDTLAEVDGAIGAMLDSLDSHGLGNDTLVVLSADNGPADLGVVNCWSIGSPGPYVGAWQKSAAGGGGGSTCKTTTWEGGEFSRARSLSRALSLSVYPPPPPLSAYLFYVNDDVNRSPGGRGDAVARPYREPGPHHPGTGDDSGLPHDLPRDRRDQAAERPGT